MGKENNETTGGTNKESERGSTGSKSSDTTRTNTETAGSGSRGSGRTGTTGSNGTSEEVVPRLVVVDEEQRKKDDRNAKRRERYAQKKAEQGETVKPRKVNTTAKKKQTPEPNSQVKAVISTISAVVASRDGMAHWQLTPQEIDAISSPLSNILAKSEAFSTLEEHSDAIALVTACMTAFVPRALITYQTIKENKKNDRRIKTNTNGKPETNQSGKDNVGSRRDNENIATNGTDNNQSEYFLGDAIAL